MTVSSASAFVATKRIRKDRWRTGGEQGKGGRLGRDDKLLGRGRWLQIGRVAVDRRRVQQQVVQTAGLTGGEVDQVVGAGTETVQGRNVDQPAAGIDRPACPS